MHSAHISAAVGSKHVNDGMNILQPTYIISHAISKIIII